MKQFILLLSLFSLNTFHTTSVHAAQSAYVACPQCHRHFLRGSRFPHQGCPGTPSEHDQYLRPLAEARELAGEQQEEEDRIAALAAVQNRRAAAVRAEERLREMESPESTQDDPPAESSAAQTTEITIYCASLNGGLSYKALVRCPHAGCLVAFEGEGSNPHEQAEILKPQILQHISSCH